MRIVVVGAGISGRAAAWSLRHHDVTVLDAAAEVGGRMRSEIVGGTTMKLGAQFLRTPDPFGTMHALHRRGAPDVRDVAAS